jgi:hypothetical protein
VQSSSADPWSSSLWDAPAQPSSTNPWGSSSSWDPVQPSLDASSSTVRPLDPTFPGNPTAQRAGEHWRDYLRRMQERQKHVMAKDDNHRKQLREARELAQKHHPCPGRKEPLVFHWELPEDVGRICMCVPVSRDAVSVWGSWGPKQRIYNSVDNKWDVCTEFDENETPDDDSEDDNMDMSPWQPTPPPPYAPTANASLPLPPLSPPPPLLPLSSVELSHPSPPPPTLVQPSPPPPTLAQLSPPPSSPTPLSPVQSSLLPPPSPPPVPGTWVNDTAPDVPDTYIWHSTQTLLDILYQRYGFIASAQSSTDHNNITIHFGATQRILGDTESIVDGSVSDHIHEFTCCLMNSLPIHRDCWDLAPNSISPFQLHANLCLCVESFMHDSKKCYLLTGLGDDPQWIIILEDPTAVLECL